MNTNSGISEEARKHIRPFVDRILKSSFDEYRKNPLQQTIRFFMVCYDLDQGYIPSWTLTDNLNLYRESRKLSPIPVNYSDFLKCSKDLVKDPLELSDFLANMTAKTELPDENLAELKQWCEECHTESDLGRIVVAASLTHIAVCDGYFGIKEEETGNHIIPLTDSGIMPKRLLDKETLLSKKYRFISLNNKPN